MGKENIMMDNRGETQSKQVNFINRKLAALTMAGSMILGGAGCTEAKIVDTSKNIPTSEENTIGNSEITILVTPEITITPTEAPTATPTPEVKTAIEPTIEGYTNETNEETGLIKLVNNETKEVDFIYNPNVWIGDEQVGGIAVKPNKMKEILGSDVKIIMPFDISEITKETNFRLEDSVSVGLSEYLGKETHIMLAEFDNPLTFVNSYIENNEINTIDEFSGDELLKKENGEIITIKNQVGLVPLACLDDNDDVTEMTDFFYVMNSNNTSEVENFDQYKKYAVGEETNVKANTVLSFWCDYLGLKGTTMPDIARSPEGYILFVYPQETIKTATEASN